MDTLADFMKEKSLNIGSICTTICNNESARQASQMQAHIRSCEKTFKGDWEHIAYCKFMCEPLNSISYTYDSDGTNYTIVFTLKGSRTYNLYVTINGIEKLLEAGVIHDY